MVYRFMPRKRYKARETGAFVHLLSGEGEVVSVYSQAINVLHPNGLLVSLVENCSQMTSLSIRAPSLFRISASQTQTLKPGDPAVFQENRLIIGDLSVALEGRKAWDGSLGVDNIRGASLWKMSLLREALLLGGKPGGLLGLIHPEDEGNPFVKKASRILETALTRGKDWRVIRGLSKLVGLGVGLTPSGDDFLSGFMLGEKILYLMSVYQQRASVAENRVIPRLIEKREIWKAKDKTNHGGRTLLWQVLQGQFPYYLVEATRGLAGAEALKDMTRMVKRAASHGETSGTDALVGLCLYMESVLDPACRTHEPKVHVSFQTRLTLE